MRAAAFAHVIPAKRCEATREPEPNFLAGIHA
jgi:hypothetical protein